MKRRTDWCGVLLVLMASFSSAQPKRHVQPQTRDQNVAFDDDLLQADLGSASSGPLIGHPARARGPMLIRARTSFVPELCQSVEKL